MESREIKFCINIRSKHTGETITLGTAYDSFEEAELEAKNVVCERCNSFNISPITKDSVWRNRKDGFMSENSWKNREEFRNRFNNNREKLK